MTSLRRTSGETSPRAEQPSRAGARARQPAIYSRLPPLAAVAEPAGCGWNPRRANPPVRRPVVSDDMPGRRYWDCRPNPAEINPDHVGASTSPGLAVVVCAAGYPRSCQRGARFGFLPRAGRNPFHQTGRDCADGHEILVAHFVGLSFRVEPASSARTVRLDLRKLTAPVVSLRHEDGANRWDGSSPGGGRI